MTLLTEDRGQALQVGAVLLFGILVILFTVWQAFVIPDQNERVEFSHNQQVQSEMVELRGNIVSTTDATTPASGSVKLGAQFPSRLLFVNPSPAAGTLNTEGIGDREFLIKNARAAEEGSGERLFWNGNDDRAYTTKSFQYTPDYRVFQGAPETVYDNTVTYNVFQDENEESSALSEQAIIDGNTITVVSLVGNYSESGIGSVTPDIQPVSTRSRNVAIENNGNENVTLQLPTKLNVSQWNALLEEEENVFDVRDGGDQTVEIELEAGQYELRMAQVGVGEGLPETLPAYIEEIEGGGEEISASENHSITVEVRDRFNVPQSNVTVNGSVVSGDGQIQPESQTTNVDGQATFEFQPISAGEVEIEFGFGSDVSLADGAIENTIVNLTVEGSGEDDDETINPNQIRIDSVSSDYNITFNNTASGSQNWTQIRIPFVSTTGQSGGPSTTDISFPGSNSQTITAHNIGGDFEDIDPDLEFEALNESGNLRNVNVGLSSGNVDFLIMTVVADNGITVNYFVAP